jgi:ubiquinone/menaquinone biosynthesis C-methylase UbiE
MTETEAPYDRFATAYREWWAPVIAPSAVGLLDRLDGQLAPDADATIVDIGTGTGTLALAALARWPAATVVGVDPAQRLLEFATEAAREAGVADRLTVRIGDAAHLPVPDGSVDAAVSSFVIQLTPSRAAAVREAYRVLRPGGLFACLAWRADEAPFEPQTAFELALEELDVDPADLPGDARPYASPMVAAAELRRADFREVRAREEWLEHRFTPQSYLDVLEHWTEDETFAALDDRMRERLRAAALRRMERLPAHEFVWRRPLVSVVGRRRTA